MTRTERNFALVEIELRLRTWRLAKLSLIFFKAVAKLLQRICIILFIVFFFFFFLFRNIIDFVLHSTYMSIVVEFEGYPSL